MADYNNPLLGKITNTSTDLQVVNLQNRMDSIQTQVVTIATGGTVAGGAMLFFLIKKSNDNKALISQYTQQIGKFINIIEGLDLDEVANNVTTIQNNLALLQSNVNSLTIDVAANKVSIDKMECVFDTIITQHNLLLTEQGSALIPIPAFVDIDSCEVPPVEPLVEEEEAI